MYRGCLSDAHSRTCSSNSIYMLALDMSWLTGEMSQVALTIKNPLDIAYP